MDVHSIRVYYARSPKECWIYQHSTTIVVGKCATAERFGAQCALTVEQPGNETVGRRDVSLLFRSARCMILSV